MVKRGLVTCYGCKQWTEHVVARGAGSRRFGRLSARTSTEPPGKTGLLWGKAKREGRISLIGEGREIQPPSACGCSAGAFGLISSTPIGTSSSSSSLCESRSGCLLVGKIGSTVAAELTARALHAGHTLADIEHHRGCPRAYSALAVATPSPCPSQHLPPTPVAPPRYPRP